MQLINMNNIKWENQIFYNSKGELTQQKVVTEEDIKSTPLIDAIDRKELLRILQNGSKYNSNCPEWVINVITKME